MHPRLLEALRYIATNLRPDRPDFYRDHHPGGDMLLTAAKTTGLARETPDDGIQLTGEGARYLRDHDGDDGFAALGA